jgi:hypothetical protein
MNCLAALAMTPEAFENIILLSRGGVRNTPLRQEALPVSSTSWEFHSGNSAAIPINCDKADDGFRFRLRRLTYARIGHCRR